MIAMAFACDLTRSVSFMITEWKCYMNAFPITGHQDDVHGTTHTAHPEWVADVVNWHVKVFARLARNVLALPEEKRVGFLRHSVLPALVEGRVDGSMLRHFPDDSLAELVGTFSDGGEREWMMLALDRLELPADRRASVESLLNLRAANGRRSDAASGTGLGQVDIDRIAVDGSAPKEFRDFAAFDLAIDGDAQATLTALKAAITTMQPSAERLRCLISLLSLEANPDGANRLAAAVAPMLGEVRSAGDQRQLAAWIQRLREVADLARYSPG